MTDVSKAAFVDPAARRRAVRLAFPLAHDGVEYREIYILRPTVGEVAAWADSQGETPLVLYGDATGAPIPQAVMSALDMDDQEEVEQAARDFLPRRLSRVLFASEEATTENASRPPSGASIAPMSGA